MSVTLISCVVGIAVTACGNDDNSSSGTTSEPQTDSLIPDSTMSSSPCPTDDPIQLVMEPESEAEELVFEELYACTNSDGTETLVINNTPVIWVLDQPQGIHWTDPSSDDATVSVFREVTSGYEGGLPIEPTMSARVSAPPSQVHLRLDAGLESVWLVVQRGTNALTARADVTSLLAGGSSERAALISCAKSGWEIGDSLARDGATQSNLVETGFEQLTGSGGECVNNLRKAQQEAASVEEADQLLTATDFRISKARPSEIRYGEAALAEAIHALTLIPKR